MLDVGAKVDEGSKFYHRGKYCKTIFCAQVGADKWRLREDHSVELLFPEFATVAEGGWRNKVCASARCGFNACCRQPCTSGVHCRRPDLARVTAQRLSFQMCNLHAPAVSSHAHKIWLSTRPAACTSSCQPA